MTRYISDLAGTLRKYFSTEGGVLLSPMASGVVDVPDDAYVLLYVRPDGTLYTVDSTGLSSLIGPIALEGTGGIVTSLVGNTWIIDGSTISGSEVAQHTFDRVRGLGYFDPDGYVIAHGVNTVSHFTSVVPAGTNEFDEVAIASIGDLYIQIGQTQDIVYNSGGPTTSGIPFRWEITYEAVSSRNTSLKGTGSFTASGTQITHSLGTLDHYTAVSYADILAHDEYVNASIGNLYVQLGLDVDTVHATGGPQVEGLPFRWEVSYDAPEGASYMTDQILRGVGSFTVTGTRLLHNLGLDHFVQVVPAGSSGFDEYLGASAGAVYVQLGDTYDTVFNTGAPGLPFYWEVSTDGSLVQGCVSFEQLTTVSGDLVSYVDQQISNITNLIPSVTASGNLMGSGTFDYQNGYVITHNFGDAVHYVSVTPASTREFDEYVVASVGNIYVRKGLDQDIVYHTGGPRADGLAFDWEVIKQGLRMVE
jgi:hypothetical protein